MRNKDAAVPEFSEFSKLLISSSKSWKLEKYITDETVEKLYILTEMLIETNNVMNLTAITDAEGIVNKHLLDSISAADMIPNGAKVIDIGCGGGFPSLPLAIVRPDIEITSLDSTAKKLTFVSSVAEKLSLNITTLATRAEDAANNKIYREKYDIAIARAVSELNVLSELCIPFVKSNGYFISMKGKDGERELSKAVNAIDILGGKIDNKVEIYTQSEDAEMKRYIFVVKKIKNTPNKYPRSYAKIIKLPL